MTDGHKAVVVFSGGMDSTTLLWQTKKRHDAVRALSFDYGQRHKVELEYAKRLAKTADVPWDLIDMSSLAKHLKGSSQTDIAMEVPHGHYTDESMKLTVVPNRNMIMLAAAVGYAIGHGYGKVCFAAHSGDHDIYPDCREKFVHVLRHAIVLATEWTPVKLWAPFVHMTKAQICAEGAALGVPFELTWSCYEGDDMRGHCGKCGTCVERIEAFKLAGVPDPTKYQD